MSSFTSLSKLKQPLPLTIEALVEPFASNPTTQGTIFCNDGVRSGAYRGIVLTQTATGQFQLSYGDGTGSSSSDRRTFTTPAGSAQGNTIYYVVATARGPTDGEIWVNGTKLRANAWCRPCGVTGIPDRAGGRDLRWPRAASRRSAAEVLATPVSQARATSVAAEVLATAASEERVSSIALEALVSVAEVPSAPTSSHTAAIVMVLGA